MLRFTAETLRNLVRKPATRPYPFTARDPFPNHRGHLVNDVDKCIFCSMCARKCPSLCIEVDKEKGEWIWEPAACVNCGICVEVCPSRCLSQETAHRAPFRSKELVVRKGTPPVKKKKATPQETA